MVDPGTCRCNGDEEVLPSGRNHDGGFGVSVMHQDAFWETRWLNRLLDYRYWLAAGPAGMCAELAVGGIWPRPWQEPLFRAVATGNTCTVVTLSYACSWGKSHPGLSHPWQTELLRCSPHLPSRT